MSKNNQRPAVRAVVEELLPISETAEAARRVARFRDERVIAAAKFPAVPFADQALWAATGNRAHDRFLNGFMFFADWAGNPLQDPRTAADFASLALEIIDDWSEANPLRGESSEMAYHDEATAQRLIHLLSLRPALSANLSSEEIERVDRLMCETAALLSTDEFHATGNNHGMFQDLALLYYAVLTPVERDDRIVTFRELALRRLKEYFESCFTADGVHIENTPTYHLMVAGFVRSMERITAAANHPDTAFYADLHRRAARYATHAIMPNGVFPPISDTTQTDLYRSSARDAFPDPGYAFSVSGGKIGEEPEDRTLVLPDSGYAIYRSAWADPMATFAFFSAAYNADYHKHSDDLSLFFMSRGVELLTEAGAYGYNYHDPLTKYAYSQFAHNSLIVDGRSLPRVDGNHDKVCLDAIRATGSEFTVRGTNARYAGTVHHRKVDVTEVSGIPELDILDTIESGEPHHYELLWHIGPEVVPVLHGQGFELYHQGTKVMDLFFEASTSTRLTLQSGRNKPRPMGWKFPAFGKAQPSNVVSIKFQGTDVSISTKIRLASFSYTDRGLASKATAWSRFQERVSLNYLFVPAAIGAPENKLIVVFSAIQGIGDFTYNYKQTLNGVDANVLYVLDDFGDQGAYYHSDHRSTDILETVISLIRRVMRENDVSAENVCTVGSSKGGTAAILLGAALSVGRIIVGAPQVKIGTFTSGPHPNILRFMAGGTQETDVHHLDQLVFNATDTLTDSTRLSVLVGSQDHHLRNHVQPLVDHMRGQNQDVSLLVLPDLPHSDIGLIYRHYLAANLVQWLRGSSEEALPYTLGRGAGSQTLRLQVYPPAMSEVAYHLYLGRQLYRKQSYSTRHKFIVDGLPAGRYRVRIHCRTPQVSETLSFTTEFITLEEP